MIHIKIINTKIQLNENKNIIKINDTKNDEFSDCVYENIKRKFALKNSEKVYVKMYEKYIYNLNIPSASLIKYRSAYIKSVPEKIHEAFNAALIV